MRGLTLWAAGIPSDYAAATPEDVGWVVRLMRSVFFKRVRDARIQRIIVARLS